MDTTKLGEVAAELMELLADEESDDSELGVVMVLAEIEGDGWTSVRFRCSDPRFWIQSGMLHAALRSERVVDDEDDDE